MKAIALLLCLLGPGLSVAATPQELVAAVERGGFTQGFRLRATVTREGESTAQPLRILMAGEQDEERHRLLIRALGPEAWRNQALLVETRRASPLRAYRFGSNGAPAQAADAHAPLFDSPLVAWNLMGEWWRWPRQAKIRDDTMLGWDCVLIESRGGSGPVARVRSWIAPELNLPLRIEFYAADGAMMGAIRVDNIFRRADGTSAARSMTLTSADNAASRFEVYSGEEGVTLAPGTFSLPEGSKPARARATQ
jgi:hypothetical protein